jgi:uncharacterized membrane protein YidH (DUF202 family)
MVSTAEEAGRKAEAVARRAAGHPMLNRFARLGLACRGILYALIGVLAVQIALGDSGEEADKQGAIATVSGLPFGAVILWIMAVGFAALVLWQLGEALFGSPKAMERISSVSRVVVYAAICVALVTMVTAGSSSSDDQKSQDATEWALGLPGGQWIVGIVGLGIIVAGGNKIYSGWKKKFEDDMNMPSDQKTRQAVERTGQVGFIAKGVSIGVIGVLVVIAAIQFDPAKAGGLDAALHSLTQTPLGPWLLVVVALGLAAYGVFCWFDAKYHRV